LVPFGIEHGICSERLVSFPVVVGFLNVSRLINESESVVGALALRFDLAIAGQNNEGENKNDH
jgi:hypothetical protein